MNEEIIVVDGAAPAIIAEAAEDGTFALSDRVLAMTLKDKVAYAANINVPWQQPMLGLLGAYMKEYPPATTRADVLQAVSVQLPLRAFISLMSAQQVVILSAAENEKQLVVAA